jgi:hypothetical protein
LLNPAKCVFGATEVTFLEYTVSAEGTRPMQDKVALINCFQQPVLVKNLRRFLGMFNFYRRFISQAASISRCIGYSHDKTITTGGMDAHHSPRFRGLQG